VTLRRRPLVLVALLLPNVAVPAARAQSSASTSAPASAPSSSPQSSSTAQPAPPLADSLQGQAKADYDSARLLFGVGDFAGALLKFRSAYEASRDPRLLYEMAACESKQHHYAHALQLLQRYRQEGGALLSAQDRVTTAQAIAAMQPLTAAVAISVGEPGADVYVDGERAGQSPLAPQVLDLGRHRIDVRKAGFRDFTTEVTVSGGAPLSLAVSLEPVARTGEVSVNAAPGDVVTIDGEARGAGPWKGELPAGRHTLLVTAPEMTPYRSEILVEDGHSSTIEVTLSPEPRTTLLPTWAWIGGGALLAGGLGLGTYFLFKKPGYDGPSGNLPPGVVTASAPVHF